MCAHSRTSCTPIPAKRPLSRRAKNSAATPSYPFDRSMLDSPYQSGSRAVHMLVMGSVPRSYCRATVFPIAKEGRANRHCAANDRMSVLSLVQWTDCRPTRRNSETRVVYRSALRACRRIRMLAAPIGIGASESLSGTHKRFQRTVWPKLLVSQHPHRIDSGGSNGRASSTQRLQPLIAAAQSRPKRLDRWGNVIK